MRRILSLSALLISVALIGSACSDASPSTPTPIAAPSGPAASSGATISGSLSGSAGGGASSNAVRPEAGPAGIVVSVAGTGLSATVDGTGRFLLLNVPGGTIALQFTGAGVNGSVTVANVAAGQTIELSLQITGTTVALEADRRASGSEEQVEGRVEALPPTTSAGTLIVAGRTIATDLNTRIVSGNQTMAFTNLAIGQRVHVKGTTSGTSLLASLIDIQNTNTSLPTNVNGIVTSLGTPFGPTAFTFFVGTTEVRGTSATEFFGGTVFADLVVGARVEVKGQPGNGFVQANRIHVSEDDDDDDDAPTIVQATGAVSAVGGKCPVIQFTVGTQTFKANGGTVFVNTTCAAIAAGMNVSATGELTGAGFAVATQVTKN